MKKLLLSLIVLLGCSTFADALPPLQPMQYINKRSQILNGIAGLAWNRVSSLDARSDILIPFVNEQNLAPTLEIVGQDLDDYESFLGSCNYYLFEEGHFPHAFKDCKDCCVDGNKEMDLAAECAEGGNYAMAMMHLNTAEYLFNYAYNEIGEDANLYLSTAEDFYEMCMEIYLLYYEEE